MWTYSDIEYGNTVSLFVLATLDTGCLTEHASMQQNVPLSHRNKQRGLGIDFCIISYNHSIVPYET